MKERILRASSIIALLSLLATACAPAAKPTQAGPTLASGESSQAAPTAAVPSTQQVTLTVWDFGGAEFEWIDSIAIPAFQEKYPNVKVEHLGIPESDYSTKLETAVAGGQVPDVALQSYTYRLWQAGHVLPLDDYMARDGLKSDDFYPIFRSWCMLDGKVYVMPVSAYIWAMVYNKDLFQQAGLPELGPDTVITFDDWLEYAEAINKPSENLEDHVFASHLFVPNWCAMNNYMSEPYVLGPDGRQCQGNADNPDWVHTWEILLKAHKEGLMVESAAGIAGDLGWGDLFKTGKLGMMPGTLGDAINMRKAGLNVGLTGQPVVTKGWQGNVGAWATAYGIMSASKHQEEAWLFLKFLTTEVARTLAMGDCDACGNPATYIPANEGWAGDDPLKLDSLKLQERVVPPPFSPDIWTAVDPFYEAWRRMTEDNVDVKIAVTEAAAECQEVLDEQWADWEKLAPGR